MDRKANPSSFDVAISLLQDSDKETVCKLAREIWYLHYPGIITVKQIDYMLEQRYQPSEIHNTLNRPISCWFKASIKDQLCGFAQCEGDDKNENVKLDKIYVHPRYQRYGVGKSLIEYIDKFFYDRNYSSLYLQVNKGNKTSIDFYKKTGFKLAREIVVEIGEGFVMDDYVFRKRLGGH